MIIIDVIAIFIILFGAVLWAYYTTNNKKNQVTIPFKESMDLVNLPIVTFVNNNVKLHFLLDTGSDDSFINCSVVNKLKIDNREHIDGSITTGGGVINSAEVITMDIYYKEHKFKNKFLVHNFDDAFKSAFGNSGIVIHGIIGSIFFQRYKYVLDFNNLDAKSSLKR